MIKVLHVHGQMVRCGAEMRTVELMPLLSRKDVRLDYCTLVEGEGPLDAKVRELGGNVYTCRLRPGALSFGKRFVKFLKESDYDIVHTHSHYFSGYLVYLAHKAGVKSRIVHFRNTNRSGVLTLGRRLYDKIMCKLIDKYATSILAVCRGAMESSWGDDWRKDPRCQVVYNGLDLSGYEGTEDKRESILKELGIGDDSKLIINVARFERQKAHDVLVNAAAKILREDPNFHFLLVGDGELREAMESRARELGIEKQLHFLGVRNDVPLLLKASDCFVLSSRWEGLPGVVLESVAAQLPTVATDLPGVREIAEHTDLISIVPVEDSDAIYRAVLKIVNNGSAQACLKRDFPSEFDLTSCAETLFEVYAGQVRGSDN